MTVVLVPAYEPGQSLVRLVQVLCDLMMIGQGIEAVVVVNDGSGNRFHDVFAAAATAGAVVIGHETNAGKGYALKAGLNFIANEFPHRNVVCADCDGQHSVEAIAAVSEALRDRTNTMVLGARDFAGDVPARSRMGNSTTKYFYSVTTGTRLEDTQTGLRGYTADVLPWLGTVPGTKFEYEFNVLLQADGAGVDICEVPIRTIYIEGNASSHFRPIVDSARIYVPLVKFGASSIAAFLLDVIALMILMAATSQLFFSVVVSRMLSAMFNFTANHRLVFRRRQPAANSSTLMRQAVRYFTLVGVILTCNYGLMRLLIRDLRLPILVAKTLTELLLFSLSFQIQRRYIFGDQKDTFQQRGTLPTAPIKKTNAKPR
jgi:glycosyltransferase involved in cell wall biosynthesis